PLGSIDFQDGENSCIKFDLTVIKKNGDKETVTDQEAKYSYPHIKIKASTALKDVLKVQRSLIAQGKDASAIPNKYKKSNGLYEFFNTSEVLAFRDKDEAYKEL